MPFYSDPLDQSTIDLITLWIDQGAIGDDGDGGESCPPGYILDCSANCQLDTLLGDGNCDNGEEGEVCIRGENVTIGYENNIMN
mgnify:CR=1 FL=1